MLTLSGCNIHHVDQFLSEKHRILLYLNKLFYNTSSPESSHLILQQTYEVGIMLLREEETKT